MIGYDHRRSGALSSLGFARISAAVFLSQGFKVRNTFLVFSYKASLLYIVKVYLLENFVATPFVPFGIQHFGAAGILFVIHLF